MAVEPILKEMKGMLTFVLSFVILTFHDSEFLSVISFSKLNVFL